MGCALLARMVANQTQRIILVRAAVMRNTLCPVRAARVDCSVFVGKVLQCEREGESHSQVSDENVDVCE